MVDEGCISQQVVFGRGIWGALNRGWDGEAISGDGAVVIIGLRVIVGMRDGLDVVGTC